MFPLCIPISPYSSFHLLLPDKPPWGEKWPKAFAKSQNCKFLLGLYQTLLPFLAPECLVVLSVLVNHFTEGNLASEAFPDPIFLRAKKWHFSPARMPGILIQTHFKSRQNMWIMPSTFRLDSWCIVSKAWTLFVRIFLTQLGWHSFAFIGKFAFTFFAFFSHTFQPACLLHFCFSDNMPFSLLTSSPANLLALIPISLRILAC